MKSIIAQCVKKRILPVIFKLYILNKSLAIAFFWQDYLKTLILEKVNAKVDQAMVNLYFVLFYSAHYMDLHMFYAAAHCHHCLGATS